MSFRLIIRCFFLFIVSVLLGSGVHAESSLSPLKPVSEIIKYSPTDYPIMSYDGRLFFSQYDNSGNNFDIIAFDMADQSSEYILRGVYGGRFVAQNNEFLVVSEKGRFANPLIVIDRRKGKRVKQIKLNSDISWATIEGNRLIAIQGAWLGSGYARKAQALIFDLPSLRIIKSVEIVGGNDVQVWNGKILSLGYELAAYDYEFNEVFRITLPERKKGGGVSCAATWPLRVYEDKAIIVANCGEILIFDLPTLKLERVIPSYAHFYTVAILNGLIFTVPTSEPRQKDSAHVYDIYTGKELAVLPINATDLFVKGNRLLAVERQFAKPSRMTLYSVDTSVIRSGQWRIEQVLEMCHRASTLLAESGDLYGAIELCKSAGIEGLVDEAKNAKCILAAVRQYAFWLSKTLDRSRDAVTILEQLLQIAPDEVVKRALAEAQLKNRVFQGMGLGTLTQEEKNTDFAHVLEDRSRLKQAETRDIEFGAFSNLFHFSAERIYIGRYDCRRCPYKGASIGVLDRTTFKEVATIPIAPGDEEYEDNLESIASDGDRLYATIGYRYEQAGRPNFVVIDKASLKILRKAHVDIPPSVFNVGGHLVACSCSFTADQTCKILDPDTLRATDAPGKTCAPNGGIHDSELASFGRDRNGAKSFVAVTKDYLVARTSPPKGNTYDLYPRKTVAKPLAIKLNIGDSLDWPISIDGNSIVIVTKGTRYSQLVKLITLPSGVTQTLFGIPTSRLRIPQLLLHDKTLFVGIGRDLMIFDIKENRVKRFIKDLIPGGFKNNGNGLDMNRIDRLLLDRGRLIAITFCGENCQIVPVADLLANSNQTLEETKDYAE